MLLSMIIYIGIVSYLFFGGDPAKPGGTQTR